MRRSRNRTLEARRFVRWWLATTALLQGASLGRVRFLMADANSALSERQITFAAAELSSQERYNPTWCKPGVGITSGDDDELYRRRARLILEAALNG